MSAVSSSFIVSGTAVDAVRVASGTAVVCALLLSADNARVGDARNDARMSPKTECNARYDPMTVVLMAEAANTRSCALTGDAASKTSTGSMAIDPASTKLMPSAAHPTSNTRGMKEPSKIATRIRPTLYCSSAHTLGRISP